MAGGEQDEVLRPYGDMYREAEAGPQVRQRRPRQAGESGRGGEENRGQVMAALKEREKSAPV